MDNMLEENGIFISYRREASDALAHLIYERLTQRGYTVFYDIESLMLGEFGPKIEKRIRMCKDFILILSPGSLDRCLENEKDWVRREIKMALELKKNIIPLAVRDFAFPKNLPKDIAKIVEYNFAALEGMHRFDQTIEEIVTTPNYLQSKPDLLAIDTRPKIIRSVACFGAPDEFYNSHYNVQYSDKIDTDKNRYVIFHAKLGEVGLLSRIRCGFSIYDDALNRKVHEQVVWLDWPARDNCITFKWAIKKKGKMPVKMGKYRVEIWVENSEVYSYHFEVYAERLKSVSNFVAAKGDNPIEDRPLSDAEKILSRPRGFMLNLGYGFFGLLTLLGIDSIGSLIVFGLIYLFFFARMYHYTKDYVNGKTFAALLITLFGGLIYTVYLLIGSLRCIFNYRHLKAKERELKQMIEDKRYEDKMKEFYQSMK